MIRSILAIFISLSFLTGSVGVMVNLQCKGCTYGNGGESGVSFSVMEVTAVSEPSSCCSFDHEREMEAESSCHDMGGCCAYELVKLKVPLVIVSQTEKIEIPVKNLSKHLLNVAFNNQAYKSIMIINKISDIPPPLTRSGLDLNCIFQC